MTAGKVDSRTDVRVGQGAEDRVVVVVEPDPPIRPQGPSARCRRLSDDIGRPENPFHYRRCRLTGLESGPRRRAATVPCCRCRARGRAEVPGAGRAVAGERAQSRDGAVLPVSGQRGSRSPGAGRAVSDDRAEPPRAFTRPLRRSALSRMAPLRGFRRAFGHPIQERKMTDLAYLVLGLGGFAAFAALVAALGRS